MGWAFGYDAGVRLSYAAAGNGNLAGGEVPAGSEGETFRFGYGKGDELARIVREANGQIAELATGDYGRLLSRNGAPFTYDGVGRRLEDDRFVYRWDWRGQLVQVTVKNTWPDSDGDGEPDVTPFAGHQVRYEYDAGGRLTHRWHFGKLPEGVTDDTQRPFIEKRVEGAGLAAEAAYGNAEESIFRWRKTYVPGPSGLDDAVQVIVEDASGAARTYTLLRDELGTVMGLMAEDEGSDPANPPVPVRYRYSPYGEAHVESGPELLRAHFDAEAEAVEISSGAVTQTVSDETAAAAGALVLDWSVSLDSATLPAGLSVERLATGSGWVPLSPEQVAVGVEPTDGGISAGGGGPPSLLVLTRNGWLRGTSYRVRLTGDLKDQLGRRFGRTESLEWRVPETPAAVTFDKKIPARFETWEAAKDDLGGRFPGGQTALFQGLWTDPVTGVAYARARWYDPRNAGWLSEDPLLDIDSPNLYAFVAHQPNMGKDPRGEGFFCLLHPEFCFGAFTAAKDMAVGLVTFPARLMEQDAQEYADRFRAYEQSGYEGWQAVARGHNQTLLEMVPGIGTGRRLGEAWEACSNTGLSFECGQKAFPAGVSVVADATVVYGVASKATQLSRVGVRAAVTEATVVVNGERLPAFSASIEVIAKAEGSVGRLTYVHQLKNSKVTDLVELQAQVDTQIASMNRIIEREGIAGLQERIRLYRADPAIEQAGRAHVKSLGPAGDSQAWLHGPDMAAGGGPTDIAGTGSLRNNSILGGQANRIADEILAMPSTTTRIEGQLVVKPAKVPTP